jgi:predicted nucleotidyltransferase
LFQHFPEISAIYWFGSWVTGIPTPGSDVDLCLVLNNADTAIRDRIPKYLPNGFPVGLDIFPYTEGELKQLATERPEWYKIITGGRMIRPGSAKSRTKKQT